MEEATMVLEPANQAARMSDRRRQPPAEGRPWAYEYEAYWIPEDGSMAMVKGHWREHPDGLDAARAEFEAWYGWVLGEGERFHLRRFSEMSEAARRRRNRVKAGAA